MRTVPVEVEDDALTDHVLRAAIGILKLDTAPDRVTVICNDEAIKLEETVEHELEEGHGTSEETPLFLVLCEGMNRSQSLQVILWALSM